MSAPTTVPSPTTPAPTTSKGPRRVLLAIVAVLASLLVPLFSAPAASAHPICDLPNTVWKISDKSFLYYPTNLKSSWASLRSGGTITYNESHTLTLSASVTATVGAEAGIVFAKASASLGLTVGVSYSKTKTWTYSANVPATTKYKYRLHAYRYSANFSVTKEQLNLSNCTYRPAAGYPSRVYHAPATGSSTDYIVWRLDKAKA